MMGIPEGSFAVAALVVIALPGIVYAGIRRWLRGELPEDRNFGLSLGRGVVLSVSLTGVYLLFFGGWVFDGLATAGKDETEIAITNPRLVGLTVLVLYLIVPAALALFFYRNHIKWTSTERFGWLKVPSSKHGYTTTPTAWDHAVRGNQQAFVRVHRENGDWIGGWYTAGSHSTTYPELRSVYIGNQYEIKDDGSIGPLILNTSLWVAITDTDVVTWFTPDEVKIAIEKVEQEVRSGEDFNPEV